jgi:hypothetical protein
MKKLKRTLLFLMLMIRMEIFLEVMMEARCPEHFKGLAREPLEGDFVMFSLLWMGKEIRCALENGRAV